MNIYICYKFCREKQWKTEMRMISMCCVSKSLEDRTFLMIYHVLNLLLNFILSCCILFTMFILLFFFFGRKKKKKTIEHAFIWSGCCFLLSSILCMNRNMCKNREPLFYLVLYFIFVMILY